VQCGPSPPDQCLCLQSWFAQYHIRLFAVAGKTGRAIHPEHGTDKKTCHWGMTFVPSRPLMAGYRRTDKATWSGDRFLRGRQSCAGLRRVRQPIRQPIQGNDLTCPAS
jgi:hypothetical protein